MKGWTEYFINVGGADLHVSVAPKTDLDGFFQAFCLAEREMIWISGWNATVIDRE